MVSGILLSAGLSVRFGSQKLLTPIPGGMTLFDHVLRTHLRADISPLVAVVSEGLLEGIARMGGRAPSYRIEEDASLPWFNLNTAWGKARLIINKRPESGMADSLKLGMEGLKESEKDAGILISLADMPKVTTEMIHFLIDVFNKGNGNIVVPTFQGKIGHPVIIHEPTYRDAISKISGDIGLRNIIQANREDVVTIKWPDDSVTADVDTISDLKGIIQGGLQHYGN